MKKLLVSLVLTAFALAPLAAAAQAPTTPRDPAPSSGKAPYDKPAGARDAAGDARPAFRPDGNTVEASNLIGMRIKNDQNKDIGEVDNLLVDPQSGKIGHVVVGLGGFMGVGERKVVVPWSELRVAAATDGKRPTATMDQAKLETAPRWERTASSDRDRATSAPSASPSGPVRSDTPKGDTYKTK
jgi:sporulation protein YlmC with PRC-barrel domain